MKHLFYIMLIFPLLWELINLVNIKRIHAFAKNLKLLNKTNPEKLPTKVIAFVLVNLAYFLWSFIGLFTFQWIAFLFIFLMSLIPKKYIWVRWLDSFITLIILIFILINAYHLHIDIYQFLLNFFSTI